MLNHSGSTIDRLKIIVKWGTFRPWRTLCHVIGGQGDVTPLASLATRGNWNAKSKSSSNVTGVERCGNPKRCETISLVKHGKLCRQNNNKWTLALVELRSRLYATLSRINSRLRVGSLVHSLCSVQRSCSSIYSTASIHRAVQLMVVSRR